MLILKYKLIHIKEKLFVLLAMLMMLLGQAIVSAQANATTLGSFDIISINGGAVIYDQLSLVVDFGPFIGPAGNLITPGGRVFNDIILLAADVGQTYTVSSGAEFDEAVEILTNGNNDYIYFSTVSDSAIIDNRRIALQPFSMAADGH